MNNESENVYVFIDVSGSMYEMGKRFLLRYLCRFINTLHKVYPQKYSTAKFSFFTWGESIEKIEIADDVPVLEIANSSKLMDIISFCEKNNSTIQKVLLFSDGYVDLDDFKKFKKENKDNVLIQTIAVGEDSNLSKLKEISSTNTVYLAENVGTAIDNLLFNCLTDISPIKSFDDIPHCTVAKQEEPIEDEDDWDA